VADNLDAKQRKLELLEKNIKLRRQLPHLYGWKNYPWMREFLECTNRTMFLTAANQIGKSSIQIRKIIDWATDPKKWEYLWPGRTPRQFWYLYPSRELATVEFDTKWIPDFLPREEMKDHPLYGWKEQRTAKKEIHSIRFNTGVIIYFKTYMQDVMNLQGSSVDWVAADEELPNELYDELNQRRNAVDGYFSMVFTATLAQEIWRKTMEPKGQEAPAFPDAWKKQVSLFDCRVYEDGTKSHWSDEKIQRSINSCKSESEVLKRIYGKFVVDGGRKYQSFEVTNNVCKSFKIPMDWTRYAGVDLGGGGDGHPSTISFIAVKPDYSMGVVYRHWRGEGELTTQTDVANRFIEMKVGQNISSAYYDYSAKDFKTITDRMGLSFQQAEKSHEIGGQVLNSLFRNKMLYVFDIPECEPIVTEFLSLLQKTEKRNAKDDSVDSVRYGVTKIPWDWSKAEVKIQFDPSEMKTATPHEEALIDRMKDREAMFRGIRDQERERIEDEIAMWGELYE
jgi:phage terminase large subunit-like protein